MAKKKRKNRRPIAPPVHSAPGTAYSPAAPPATAAPPARPEGAEPPGVPMDTEAPARAPKRAREVAQSRAAARRRRSRRRTYLLIGSIVLVLAAAIAIPRIMSNRATAELNKLGETAGCSKLETTSSSGAGEHLAEGEVVEYESSPPTFGKHSPSTLPAGVYDAPLSTQPTEAANVFRAVHSLEHGSVILWHNGLKKKALEDLKSEYRTEQKVLVIPYPDLEGDTQVALTAWGRIMECEEASTRVIDKFVERFREARTAPEPKQRI